MTVILGVDGGNSKTLAAVMDSSGTILGVGRSASGSHQAFGLEAALTQIRLAGECAMEEAGVSASDVDVTYYTLAGADLPEDFDLLLPALESLGLGQQVGLNNDSIGALRSGTDNPNAIVVVLGAGMNAAGRNAAGQEVRLHALGWISGDCGGGGQIAREAVRAAARAWDGRGRPTVLSDIVPRVFGVRTIEEMIRTLYLHEEWYEDGEGRLLLHQLVPLVFHAANEGDAVACDLLRRSGEEVVTTAMALSRRLGLDNIPVDVVLAGGVFRAESTILIDAVRAGLQRIVPRATLILPVLEPVVGALFCGLDLLGILVDSKIRCRAGESYAGRRQW